MIIQPALPKVLRGLEFNLLPTVPEKISANKEKSHLKDTEAYQKNKMDGFPLGWCFRNWKAFLIKSANLLQHWPPLAPVTLMEETIYQKPLHFKSRPAWFSFLKNFVL